jgi:hypothetical protein
MVRAKLLQHLGDAQETGLHVSGQGRELLLGLWMKNDSPHAGSIAI